MPKSRSFSKKVTALSFLLVFLSASCFSEQAKANPLVKMSIQQLMQMEVTSVSRSAQPLSQAPAAIFVLNQEDIRRSGATNIPTLLRMVPGMDVASVTSSQWAISSRGFNSTIANKLLVLIDGRSVYTPLYAGVYWDVEDTLLEDIERIEVIRGPGATVWGSNAVNGVINIITKHSKDTIGSMVTAGAGTEERGFGAYRYGAAIDKDTTFRVYGKYFDRDASLHGNDSWYQGRAGFRADKVADAENEYMLQGGYYNGEVDSRGTDYSLTPPFRRTFFEDDTTYGGHALWRWHHKRDERSDSDLQIYYQQSKRDQIIFEESRYTLDFDWNARFGLTETQEITWGLGYRFMADDTAGDVSAFFRPADKIDHLFSAFVQDEITLIPEKLWFTAGSKFEHNDYSGFEVQPSVRLSYEVTNNSVVWAAVSRAVRIPTRLDHDLNVSGWTTDGTALTTLYGDSRKDSEELLAYELGYRVQPKDNLSIDSTIFFNQYDNLTTYTIGTPFTVNNFTTFTDTPYYIDDNMDGETYGAEISTQYQPVDDWKLIVAYTFLDIQLHSTNDALFQERTTEGNNPQNQASIRSLVNLPHNFEFDSQLRYVDSLVSINTSSYVELDLRLGWHMDPNTEFSVVGQNLLDNHHVEFASDTSPTAPQVERSVYAKVTRYF